MTLSSLPRNPRLLAMLLMTLLLASWARAAGEQPAPEAPGLFLSR